MTHVVVSMPAYRTPAKLLTRAVRSVLNQTHEDLTLVVVGDGYAVPKLPDDPRLVVHQLPDNRGRYFADAVVTGTLDDRDVWVVHDADDWSEPDRFERLLPAMVDGAAVARYWRHNLRGGKTYIQEPARARLADPSEPFVHIGHWCSGAYTGERVRRAGGIHPGYRVGFDTLFVRMVALTGPVGISDYAAYHWCRRDSGSLTTSPKTRFGSPYRRDAKADLVKLNAAAWARRHDDPGQVIRDDVPAKLAREVDVEVAVLAAKLDRAASGKRPD